MQENAQLVEKNSYPIIFTKKDEWFEISFKFKPEFIAAIKSIGEIKEDWKYEPEHKKWYIHQSKIKKLLPKLNNAGADTEELEKYINTIKMSAKTTATKEKKQKKILEINVRRNEHEKAKLNISFKFNQDVLKTIKALKYRQYNEKTKEWTIKEEDAKELLKNLKAIKDADIKTNLYEYIGPKEIIIPDYNNMQDIRKPFKHQLEAAEFLIKKKKALLADEMGGGKTKSSILAAYALPPPRLIICPASVKINWSLEIQQVDLHGKIKIIKDNQIDPNMDWTIINYDILEKHIEDIKTVKWSCIVCDEAHYIKSIGKGGKPASIRAKNVINITEDIEYAFLLTGTPMTSRPKDLFNLLKIMKHPCSTDWIGYAYAYCGADQNQYGTSFNGASNIDKLHEKIKPYILRRLKKDMLDLPEKTRTFNYVDIDLERYKQELEEYMKNKKYFVNISEALLKLNKMKMIIAEQKTASTIEMIKSYIENDEPVVVMSNYTNVIDKIVNTYKKDCVKLTGECSQKKRQEAVELFQSGQKKIFVGNLIAAGVGITLTQASNIIINDMDWVPGNHLQAEDRIHRIGQTNKCTIIYQVAKEAEIDEIMAKALSKKLSNINAVIDGYNGEDGEDFGIAAEVVRQLENV